MPIRCTRSRSSRAGRALGYTLSIPDEDKVLNSLSEMKDELAVFMGGRVAEEIFCDDITTGASNDLERASKMARAIVTQYGMSPLGTQVFGQPNHEVFLGRDYGNTQDYSEETARRIDEEVAKIMKEAHDRAHAILSSHADQMDLMASVLLERETVEGEACEALLDNKWDEYLAREDDIIAAKEAKRRRPAPRTPSFWAAQGEGDGANGHAGRSGWLGRCGRSRRRRDAGRPELERRAGRAGRPGSERPLPHSRRACRSLRYAHPGRGERGNRPRGRHGFLRRCSRPGQEGLAGRLLRGAESETRFPDFHLNGP